MLGFSFLGRPMAFLGQAMDSRPRNSGHGHVGQLNLPYVFHHHFDIIDSLRFCSVSRKFPMNKDFAQRIIDASTEVSDGLFVFIDQGQKVLDCTSFSSNEGEVFTIDLYVPNGEFEPVMNVTYVGRDFIMSDYVKKATEYYPTAREMKARVSEYIMNSAYF